MLAVLTSGRRSSGDPKVYLNQFSNLLAIISVLISDQSTLSNNQLGKLFESFLVIIERRWQTCLYS